MERTGNMNSEMSELLGARMDYYLLLDHYENQLKTKCEDTLEKLIPENFPLLSTGLAGSALHGLIHLGYGYAAKNSRFQLNFCHQSAVYLYLFYFIAIFINM